MSIKRITLLLLTAISILGLCACGKNIAPKDPHEGQVYLYDGFDWIWYTPLEGVQTNELSKDDFKYEDDTPYYIGDGFEVLKGIDVSEHQKSIDWTTVGQQGYDFVYIRCGRRGYTEGGLFKDENFETNMRGAADAGFSRIGVYFYSQAVTVSEAIEEANYLLDLIRDYRVDLPICYDWERVDTEDSRTRDIQKDTITDCAVAFCETIKNAGLEPIVYYNRTSGYYKFDLTRLTDYKVWFSLYCTPPDVYFPSFYYHIDMWQYTQGGYVPGIPTETDINYMFIKK